jgi:hypothetical protein
MGYPLAALIPVLTNTLAHGRFTRRVESTLAEIIAELQAQHGKVENFTDAQFSLTVGIVKTICETIDEAKLRTLKAAVLNIASSDYLGSFEAQLFSRILLDISAAEISCLVRHRDVPWFIFRTAGIKEREGVLSIKSTSVDATIATGLMNLGLIVRSPDEGTFSYAGEYALAPIVGSLLDLIEGNGAAVTA